MSVRILTTHIWTKLFIPIIWISRLLAIGIVLCLLEVILPDNTLGVVVLIVAFFATIILHGLFIEQWYHILQTYLYVRISLRTRISLNEAKHLLLLFAPSDQGAWYPMIGIKDLPKNYRRQVLFDSAQRIYAELGYQFGISVTDSKSTDNEYIPCYDMPLGHNASKLPLGISNLVAMLCKMAKGDGVITKEEIDVVDDFFTSVLKLSLDERKKAIEIFEKARAADTPFDVYAREFRDYHKDNKELLEAIVSLLTSVAFADGELSAEEEILLNQAIDIFEVEGVQYKKYKSAYRNRRTARVEVQDSYYAKVLGLEDDVTPVKIKAVYRKLAVQYHPDKVSHLGPKIKKVAENEMKRINEAYEYFQKKYQF